MAWVEKFVVNILVALTIVMLQNANFARGQMSQDTYFVEAKDGSSVELFCKLQSGDFFEKCTFTR